MNESDGKRPAQVGVVIPCFNDRPDHLRETVASALAQDVPVEVVVVSDGSTAPDTLSAIDRLPDNVRVIRQANGGPASARNTGIRALSTNFILPLDADDRISPDFAREAIEALQADADVRIAYAEWVSFGDRSGRRVPPLEVGLAEILPASQFVAASVFRRSDWVRVGGYDESLRVGHEDYEFWIRLLASGGRAVRMPNAVFYYRIRPGSRERVQGADLQAMRATRTAVARNNPDHLERLLVEAQMALTLLHRENRRLATENHWFHRYFGWAWKAVRRLRDGAPARH